MSSLRQLGCRKLIQYTLKVLFCFVVCAFVSVLTPAYCLDQLLQFSWQHFHHLCAFASLLGLRESSWHRVIQLALCLRQDQNIQSPYLNLIQILHVEMIVQLLTFGLFCYESFCRILLSNIANKYQRMWDSELQAATTTSSISPTPSKDPTFVQRLRIPGQAVHFNESPNQQKLT